jgi:hypothetical protein
MCRGLLHIHFYRGIELNGYLDHQWCDHIDTMKGGATVGCGKPRWIRNVVKKWANDK